MPSIHRECHSSALGLTEGALGHVVRQENTQACLGCIEYNMHLLYDVEMTNSPRDRVENELPSIICVVPVTGGRLRRTSGHIGKVRGQSQGGRCLCGNLDGSLRLSAD